MPLPRLALSEPVGPSDAPLVVLGHSLGTSRILWAEVLPRLATSHRVTCWELPGHGQSPAATAPFTVPDLADAVVQQLDSAGDQPFSYAGVSLGGTVGLALAERHPERVRSAVVISSGPSVQVDAWQERAAMVRALGTGSLVPGTAERWFASATLERRPDLVERALEALAGADDESYALACEALAGYDAAESLGRIGVPVLAMWGKEDALVRWEASASIGRGVPHGRAVSISEAAHQVPLEQPQVVADNVASFWADEKGDAGAEAHGGGCGVGR